jgi:hypothetical protein
MELELKTPWRDGTTHLVMSPLEFMQRLAALIQPAATAFANGCFAAVNPGRQMPGLGRGLTAGSPNSAPETCHSASRADQQPIAGISPGQERVLSNGRFGAA